MSENIILGPLQTNNDNIDLDALQVTGDIQISVGTSRWGEIGGTIEDQEDLIALLDDLQAASESYADSVGENLDRQKQDKLTAGANITIDSNTINAIVPTKLSELENDTNFLPEDEIAEELDKKADYFQAGDGLQLLEKTLSIITITNAEIDSLME